MRASNSGITLSEADAAIVKGMLERGDRQHDIAAWFGVNGGRIAEISTGSSFPKVAMQTEDLPPAGPYQSMRTITDAKRRLEQLHQHILELANEVKSEIDRL